MNIDTLTMEKCLKVLKAKELEPELQVEIIGALLEGANSYLVEKLPTTTPNTNYPWNPAQPWGPTWIYSQWPSKKLDTEITCSQDEKN